MKLYGKFYTDYHRMKFWLTRSTIWKGLIQLNILIICVVYRVEEMIYMWEKRWLRSLKNIYPVFHQQIAGLIAS